MQRPASSTEHRLDKIFVWPIVMVVVVSYVVRKTWLSGYLISLPRRRSGEKDAAEFKCPKTRKRMARMSSRCQPKKIPFQTQWVGGTFLSWVNRGAKVSLDNSWCTRPNFEMNIMNSAENLLILLATQVCKPRTTLLLALFNTEKCQCWVFVFLLTGEGKSRQPEEGVSRSSRSRFSPEDPAENLQVTKASCVLPNMHVFVVLANTQANINMCHTSACSEALWWGDDPSHFCCLALAASTTPQVVW